MRVSGKHNDLDNVGPSLRHHTFFEMLGNFSFGDYFKKEAIVLRLGTADRRLEDAGRSAGAYRSSRAKAASRATTRRTTSGGSSSRPIGFSSSAPTTTSGRWATPDRADAARRSTTSAAPARIRKSRSGTTSSWSSSGARTARCTPLPAPSIDTGMGLERVTSVLQGKSSNYDTDLFTPLLTRIGRTGRREVRARSRTADTSMRVVADHIRATTFLIGDGVIPSNEWRGYVLRKIMRRAMRHGKHLGLDRTVPARARGRPRSRDGRRVSRYPEEPRDDRTDDPRRGASLRSRC